MTGFHAAYLNLTEAATLTFQYMGSGNAVNTNQFGIDRNDDGILQASEYIFQSGTTTACRMNGGVVPQCDKIGIGFGENQFSESFGPGQIHFLFKTQFGETLDNTGKGLGNPDTALGVHTGYFLGVDPYIATGQFQTSGSAVYAGLTDLPASTDHDYQDLGVRISIPEPSGLALVMAAFGGLLVAQRRVKRA